MIPEEHVPLSTLTTLRVGGPARFVFHTTSAEDVEVAVHFARERNLPVRALGEGSNLLASDEGYPGVLIRMEGRTIQYEDDGEYVRVAVDAGYMFDTLVDETTRRGLWGLENLAAIPGTIGAAPVQNIGAYGAEIADVLEYVRLYDARSGEHYRVAASECAFGYRDSMFKRNADVIITQVGLRLAKSATPNVAYKDFQTIQAQGVPLASSKDIAAAVRSIRGKKFPDRTHTGTAGSFFKNPIISHEAYRELLERYAELPGFRQEHGIKIPIAYVLDTVLKLRGYTQGPVGVYEHHALVLVTHEGAQADDVATLADTIARQVYETIGVSLEREVQTL